MKKILNQIKIFFFDNSALTIFIIMMLLTAIIYGEKFLAPSVFINLFTQMSIQGLVALGMTCVILAGGIDLSVGSIVGLSSIIAAMISDGNVLIVIIVCLSTGFTCGLLNGLIVEKMKIVPFIATLTTMVGFRGIILLATGSKSVPAKDATDAFRTIAKWDLKWLRKLFLNGYSEAAKKETGLIISSLEKVPLFIYFLVALIILMYGLKYTKLGRSIYAVGGNAVAARVMGIHTGRTVILTYIISGVLSGIAGMVLCSRLRAGQYAAGQAWEMDAIAATVIGGTLITGGKGKISGTMYGVLILGLIEQIFIMQGNINVWWQNIVSGAILMIVVLIQSIATKRKKMMA